MVKAKIGRQETIPGMQDNKIPDIESAAFNYAEGRDERMDATRKEVELKGELIEAMHKHKKSRYKRGPIEIELIVEKEKVKVRIQDQDEISAG